MVFVMEYQYAIMFYASTQLLSKVAQSMKFERLTNRLHGPSQPKKSYSDRERCMKTNQAQQTVGYEESSGYKRGSISTLMSLQPRKRSIYTF
jgi:hypothetical protein